MTNSLIHSNRLGSKADLQSQQKSIEPYKFSFSYGESQSYTFEFPEEKLSSKSNQTLTSKITSSIESQIKYYEEKILSLDEDLLLGLISEQEHEKMLTDYEKKLHELRYLYE